MSRLILAGGGRSEALTCHYHAMTS